MFQIFEKIIQYTAEAWQDKGKKTNDERVNGWESSKTSLDKANTSIISNKVIIIIILFFQQGDKVDMSMEHQNHLRYFDGYFGQKICEADKSLKEEEEGRKEREREKVGYMPKASSNKNK